MNAEGVVESGVLVARAVIDAVLERAADASEQIAVAVVDISGEVIESWRGAELHPLFGDVVVAEAATAATFGMPRQVLQDWQHRKPVLHVQLSQMNRYPVMPSAGATALLRQAVPIGAVAVDSRGRFDDRRLVSEAIAAVGLAASIDLGDERDDPSGTIASDVGGFSGMSAQDARGLVTAAVERASALERAVSVAVVDERGALLSGARTHAAGTTLDLAVAKAYTAAVLKSQTVDLERWQDEQPVRAMQLSMLGGRPIIADFGGFPIRRAGRLIGGLGISGAREDEDQQIGLAVLADATL